MGKITTRLSRKQKQDTTPVLTLADGPVRLEEVWLQVDLKQVSSDSLYRVIEGKNMDPLSILHIGTWLDAAGENGSWVNEYIQLAAV